MILALDIGNTNIVLGGVEDGRALFVCRLSTAKTRTDDEYAALLRLVAEQAGADLKKAEGAIIASVVPQLNSVLFRAVKTASGKEAVILGPGVKTGLNIRIEDPSELGGDFVAAAVAAGASYHLPCITVDMGTATAIGVIDKKGCYIGGVICPGVMLGHDALAAGTSQLPHVSPVAPAQVIGKDTEACMKSGLVFGTAAMLDGLIERIETELGETVSVVATGDWADNIVPYCRRKDIIVDRELVMRGLWMIFSKNRR